MATKLASALLLLAMAVLVSAGPLKETELSERDGTSERGLDAKKSAELMKALQGKRKPTKRGNEDERAVNISSMIETGMDVLGAIEDLVSQFVDSREVQMYKRGDVDMRSDVDVSDIIDSSVQVLSAIGDIVSQFFDKRETQMNKRSDVDVSDIVDSSVDVLTAIADIVKQFVDKREVQMYERGDLDTRDVSEIVDSGVDALSAIAEIVSQFLGKKRSPEDRKRSEVVSVEDQRGVNKLRSQLLGILKRRDEMMRRGGEVSLRDWTDTVTDVVETGCSVFSVLELLGAFAKRDEMDIRREDVSDQQRRASFGDIFDMIVDVATTILTTRDDELVARGEGLSEDQRGILDTILGLILPFKRDTTGEDLSDEQRGILSSILGLILKKRDEMGMNGLSEDQRGIMGNIFSLPGLHDPIKRDEMVETGEDLSDDQRGILSTILGFILKKRDEMGMVRRAEDVSDQQRRASFDDIFGMIVDVASSIISTVVKRDDEMVARGEGLSEDQRGILDTILGLILPFKRDVTDEDLSDEQRGILSSILDLILKKRDEMGMVRRSEDVSDQQRRASFDDIFGMIVDVASSILSTVVKRDDEMVARGEGLSEDQRGLLDTLLGLILPFKRDATGEDLSEDQRGLLDTLLGLILPFKRDATGEDLSEDQRGLLDTLLGLILPFKRDATGEDLSEDQRGIIDKIIRNEMVARGEGLSNEQRALTIYPFYDLLATVLESL